MVERALRRVFRADVFKGHVMILGFFFWLDF